MANRNVKTEGKKPLYTRAFCSRRLKTLLVEEHPTAGTATTTTTTKVAKKKKIDIKNSKVDWGFFFCVVIFYSRSRNFMRAVSVKPKEKKSQGRSNEYTNNIIFASFSCFPCNSVDPRVRASVCVCTVAHWLLETKQTKIFFQSFPTLNHCTFSICWQRTSINKIIKIALTNSILQLLLKRRRKILGTGNLAFLFLIFLTPAERLVRDFNWEVQTVPKRNGCHSIYMSGMCNEILCISRAHQIQTACLPDRPLETF